MDLAKTKINMSTETTYTPIQMSSQHNQLLMPLYHVKTITDICRQCQMTQSSGQRGTVVRFNFKKARKMLANPDHTSQSS